MNLTQLQTAVQDHGYGTDTTTTVTDLLNRRYEEVWGERRWWWREKRDTSQITIAGYPTYSLSSIADMDSQDAVRIQTAGQSYAGGTVLGTLATQLTSGSSNPYLYLTGGLPFALAPEVILYVGGQFFTTSQFVSSPSNAIPVVPQTVGATIAAGTTVTVAFQYNALAATPAATYDLEWVPSQQILSNIHLWRDTGVPTQWSFVDGVLQLWPIPDQAYNIIIDYMDIPPPLVNATDTPVFPIQHHNVLVWGAVADLCFRERDVFNYRTAAGEYQAALDKMRKAESLRERQSSRQVTQSGLYDIYSTQRSWFV